MESSECKEQGTLTGHTAGKMNQSGGGGNNTLKKIKLKYNFLKR